MTLQIYTVLWPVQTSLGTIQPGGSVQFDDANSTTIQMLKNGVIELQSSPTVAADLASDLADAAYTQAHGVNPFHDYRGEQGQDQGSPVTPSGSPSLPSQPLEGVDGDDALRYQ